MHDGKAVPVGPKVVETLLALVERAGETVAKEALIERVWADDCVEESNLAQNIYVIRKTFRVYGVSDAIETVPGSGYRLRATAHVVTEPEPRGVKQRPFRQASRPAAVAVAAFAAAAFALLVLAITHGSDEHLRSDALTPEAMRLYTIGRYYWNLRTSAGVHKSMRYFEQVIERDSASPLGYVGMADANLAMGDYCYGTHRPAVYFARARAYAVRALALDARSAPAHATLGFVMLHERKSAEASDELRRAIALDPGYGPAREWYGITLAREGRLSEARLQLETASRLDPLSSSTTAWLSRVAYRNGRFNDAAAYWQETLELLPDFVPRAHVRGHPTWASIENIIR